MMKTILAALAIASSSLIASAADAPLIPDDVNQILGRITPKMAEAEVEKIVRKHYPDAIRSLGSWSGQTGYIEFKLTTRYSISVAEYNDPKDVESRFVHADMILYVYDWESKRRINISFHEWDEETKNGGKTSEQSPERDKSEAAIRLPSPCMLGEAFDMRRTKMKGMSVLAALSGCLLAAHAEDDIRNGRLGHPRGTYLTIEGVCAEGGKVGSQALLVDTINGRKLDEPIRIWIDNIGPLPKGARCTVRGYESGKMVGLPHEVAKAENYPLPQSGWQYFPYFIMTSVVQPEGLAVQLKHGKYPSAVESADHLRRWREEMKRHAEGDIPSGGLGYPLGTYLTIEGARAERFKAGSKTLLVDTVNGKKLDEPIGIWIDNIAPLPEGDRCIVRGYESGEMFGLPDGVAKAENLPLPQAAWQFIRYFIMTSVVQPEGLAAKPKGMPYADRLRRGHEEMEKQDVEPKDALDKH